MLVWPTSENIMMIFSRRTLEPRLILLLPKQFINHSLTYIKTRTYIFQYTSPRTAILYSKTIPRYSIKNGKSFEVLLSQPFGYYFYLLIPSVTLTAATHTKAEPCTRGNLY